MAEIGAFLREALGKKPENDMLHPISSGDHNCKAHSQNQFFSIMNLLVLTRR